MITFLERTFYDTQKKLFFVIMHCCQEKRRNVFNNLIKLAKVQYFSLYQNLGTLLDAET